MGFGWKTRRRFDDMRRAALQFVRCVPLFGGGIEQPIRREEVEQRFKYIFSSKRVLDLNRAPSFLIAGPQRTGTTWLHRNLVQHPQIFLPERKEIFYFNTLNLPDHRKHRSRDLAWYLSYFYIGPWRYLSELLRCRRMYSEAYRPITRGEATASLAAMPKELIREVVSLNPDVKVIILVRNPIDRAWSHAKMAFLRKTGKEVDEIPASVFEEFFRDDYERACADFTQCIDNWRSALKPGNLFVGRYSDVRSQPEQLLLSLYSFLGVRSDRSYIPREALTRINPTAEVQIPERFLNSLNELFGEEVEKLKIAGLIV